MSRRLIPLVLISLVLAACGGDGDDGGGNDNTVAAPTGLSYQSPVQATVDAAMTALSPTVTGSVTSYTVSPALPAALSISATTGTISGTPTAAAAQATYTITASNAGGSATFGLALTVNPAPPSELSYSSPTTATAGTAITPLAPTVTGTVASYSVDPALPAGLLLNATTGEISGTPTTATAQATYVVTASNASGSTTFDLVLTILAPAPVTATGVFIDSPVSGLSYTSGGQSGVTEADGAFLYEVGQSVTFSVGGVTLGTTGGQAAVTPLDLVANSSSSTLTVQNIIRFLMLLDSDANAANGIAISEALRARAASWSQVDFTTNDLDAALASIIPDTEVDGTLRQLPTAAAAQTHFESSFRCLYAGYYRGTYAGADNGNFAFTVHPPGGLSGAAYSVADEELIGLQFNPTLLQVHSSSAFVAGLAGTGSSFSGQFTGHDQVSGTWSEGTFSGSRYAGTTSAAYKFVSVLMRNGGPAVGSFFTEIDAEGAVTAKAHVDYITNATPPELTVTQNGSQLTITDEATGGSLTATVDTSALTLTGTWTNPVTGDTGTLLSTGCRLR